MIFLIAKTFIFLAVLFASFRVWKGPRILDRLIALDTIGIAVIGLMAVFSIEHKTTLYLDVILIFSLLNFIGVVAFMSYLNKSYPREKLSQEDLHVD